MTATSHGFATLPKTRAPWWTLGLGLCALLVGPLLGFGSVGLLLSLATLITAVTAYRHGERSWTIWLGAALAVAVVCYFPFMSSDYPYTTQ